MDLRCLCIIWTFAGAASPFHRFPCFSTLFWHFTLLKRRVQKRRCAQQCLFSSSLMPVHLSFCPKTTASIITRIHFICQYPLQGKSVQTAFKANGFSDFPRFRLCPDAVLLISCIFRFIKPCFFLYNGVMCFFFSYLFTSFFDRSLAY